MKVRMDVNFDGSQPEIVGLSIQGFGWLIGGAESGELSLSFDVDLLKAKPGRDNKREFTVMDDVLRATLMGYVQGAKRK